MKRFSSISVFLFFIAFQCSPAFSSEPDWMKIEDELIGLLQDLINIDSQNPPGNELEVCKALKKFFKKEGISSQIYKVDAKRANLVARLNGNGSQAPILLLAHTDAVPVNEENWSVNPFSGIIDEGFIYGRGALDDKSMLAVNAMTLALLWRQKIPLRRDIIFLATADEETGGSKGAGWMFERHRDKLEAVFALNEGGRIIVRDGKPLYIAVQTEEKIAYNVKLVAKGTTGHASIPRLDNAISSLSRALEKLERYPGQQQFDAVTSSFFTGVTEVDPLVEYSGDNIKTDVPLYLSLVTNTISPTMIEGGIKTNVHPPYAAVNLNCRLLPWQDVDVFVDSLENWIALGPYEFKYKTKPLGPEASLQDGLGYILIEQICNEMFPGTPVLPYLSPGMTDGTRFRHEGIPTYGLLPFPLDEEEVWRLHAADERISIDALMTGMKLVYRVVELGVK